MTFRLQTSKPLLRQLRNRPRFFDPVSVVNSGCWLMYFYIAETIPIWFCNRRNNILVTSKHKKFHKFFCFSFPWPCEAAWSTSRWRICRYQGNIWEHGWASESLQEAFWTSRCCMFILYIFPCWHLIEHFIVFRNGKKSSKTSQAGQRRRKRPQPLPHLRRRHQDLLLPSQLSSTLVYMENLALWTMVRPSAHLYRSKQVLLRNITSIWLFLDGRFCGLQIVYAKYSSSQMLLMPI